MHKKPLIFIEIILVAMLSWYLYANMVSEPPKEVEQVPENSTEVKLYFYNPGFDQGPGGVACSAQGLVAVERKIPKTTMPLTETIKLLLGEKVSSEEKAQGITSEFPLAGVVLKSAAIQDGTATLTFDDPQNRTSGGSCFVSILRAQVEATAKQFPSVTSVRLMPEELFQP